MGNCSNKDVCFTQTYTLEEVAKHNKKGDAWLIIKDNVYDVSEFKHPGGHIIHKGYGIDATELFYNPNVRHSSHAKNLLKKYYIGQLKKTDDIVSI